MFLYYPNFISMPETIELPDGDTWILEYPFAYIRQNEDRIIVPPSGPGSVQDMLRNPNWTTDYGSIPMVFQNILRKDGRYAPAYVVHDWLYSSEKFDRATCDWILLEMLQELGAYWLTRNTIYSGVRIGGGFVWRNHDPAKVSALRAYEQSFLLTARAQYPPLYL
ncbi:MAG: DUF1353 domain-containing protein [Patescibacteria group bacterium]|nr:DUF1353 domain-containing protein [Patescibacteria group bacterium]